jgi:hypothetical protein
MHVCLENNNRNRPAWLFAYVSIPAIVFGCSLYANLALKDNLNNYLGAEYFCIARSLVNGDGYANPFQEQTGATAWMPPLLSFFLAGLLWISDGNRETVMAVVVILQVYTIVSTGVLVIAVTRRTRVIGGAVLAPIFFIAFVLGYFYLWFQLTDDTWLCLLAMDVLVVWFAWCQPLQTWLPAAGSGLLGGLCALVNPVIGLASCVLLLREGIRQCAWSRLALAVALAGSTIGPWTIRNYLVFGRIIPIKSNLAYELYQSQCLQADGLLNGKAFSIHPFPSATGERREYKRLGEMAFLDRKSELFWTSVHKDPLDFLERVASRFVGATLWYEPLHRFDSLRQPWVVRARRAMHPLPLLALVVLVFTNLWRPLNNVQWIIIVLYVLHLLPYVLVSYYDRYAMPLLGVKVLLVLWAADRLLFLARSARIPYPERLL